MQFLFPSSLAAFCPALHSHSCCCTAIVNLSLKFRPTKSIYWNEFPPTPTIKPHSGKTASPFIRSICVQPQARNSFCWCGQGNPSIYAMYQGEQKKTFWIQFMFTPPHTISKYLVPSKFPGPLSSQLECPFNAPWLSMELLHCCIPNPRSPMAGLRWTTTTSRSRIPSQSPCVSWPLFQLCINCNHNSQLHISLNFSENSFCKLPMQRHTSSCTAFLAHSPTLLSRHNNFKRFTANSKYLAVGISHLSPFRSSWRYMYFGSTILDLLFD